MANSRVNFSTASAHPEKMRDDEVTPQYWRDLVDYTRVAPEEPPFVDFKKLHIMNITHLLNKLSHIKAEVEHKQTIDTGQMDNLQRTLHQYVEAIRDYRDLTSLAELPDYANDKRMSLEGAFPYLAVPYREEQNRPYDTRYRTIKESNTQISDPIREVLRKTLPNRLSWTDKERQAKREAYGAGEAPELYSPFVESVARFIIGTLGGCALIVPMIVMIYDPSLTKSVIVVSVATLLFALVVGMVFDTNNQDTITATATYAAVLVVFIGTSS